MRENVLGDKLHLAKGHSIEIWIAKGAPGLPFFIFYVHCTTTAKYLFKTMQHHDAYVQGLMHEKHELTEEEYHNLDEFDFQKRTDVEKIKLEIYNADEH